MVRRSRFHIHCYLGELIRQALLYQRDHLRRGRLLYAPEIESAGHAAKRHLAPRRIRARREVLLQERRQAVAVTAIENGDPRTKLLRGRCMPILRLGHGSSNDEQERGNGVADVHSISDEGR